MSLFMIAKNTKYYLAIGFLTVATSMPANALTLKKGQVNGAAETQCGAEHRAFN